MEIPKLCFIWSTRRELNKKQIGNLIPDRSDLAGYSIFEEANYYGFGAAEKVQKKNGWIKSCLISGI